MKEISDALTGLKDEMGENRNNTQQIHEKQTQVARKIEEEEERYNVSGEIKKCIDSVRQPEEKHHGGIRYEPTKVPQIFSVGLKSEVRVKVPTGLSYSGAEEFLDKYPR